VTPYTAKAILEELARKGAQALNVLDRCRTLDYLPAWTEGPQLGRRFAQLLLKQGHPTLALEVAARSLERYPGDHELLYYRALALARCGNPTRANWFVQEMLKLHDLPPALRSETLSLAGRVRKDRANRTADPEVRRHRFREALDYYRQAYAISRETFPGINAATLALLAGDRELSKTLAAEVRDLALAELERAKSGDEFWTLATLGEAYLLLGDLTAAKGRYSQALRIARDAHGGGDIEPMLRQLRLLANHLPIGDELLGLFNIGPVVVFAGHGLDRPGQAVRFPNNPELENLVRRAIRIELDALESTIGYYCPGCGSDILFGEVMRERNAELHMVLPFDEEDLIVDRITYGLAEFEPWRQRYEELRGFLHVTQHFATTEKFLNDRVLYDFAGTFMQGLAIARASQVGDRAIAVVVQDSDPQSPPSSLTTFIANWRHTGRELRIIDLAALRRRTTLPPALPRAAPPPAANAAIEEPAAPTIHRTIQSMLFADVAGFSGLPEAHLPAFFIQFLALVEKELRQTPTLFRNTWGDGLYIVFADVVTAADCAMRLMERFEKFQFEEFGFPLTEDKKPGVRIGLHTGPVFEGHDAIIGKSNYFGSHVNRAARIEPVTMPGSAFVSEQFAAALALRTDHNFLCEFQGLIHLAKDYDICHLYRLTTATESDAN
jgi:class 3 adenylate cyclase/tetratricopeptide (TPR) repeat protein